MRFASRQDAGRRLAASLRKCGVTADVVLGLPRGGVAVAAEVARELKRPLDVLVVRKVGHPFHREFAVGAMAEPDILVLDEMALVQIPAPRTALDRVIAEETARLRSYAGRFHRPGARPLKDQTVLLVDDGLATGATAGAAVLSARRQQARRILVAAPVASVSAFEKLKQSADDVLILWVDPAFGAVGQYYDDFSQTTDDEVISLLNAARPPGE